MNCFTRATIIVEPHLSIRRFEKAVLATSALTGKADVAGPALQTLGEAKLQLFLGCGERPYWCGENVAKAIFEIDIVIAGINIAIMLDGESLSTGLGKPAQAGRCPIASPS